VEVAATAPPTTATPPAELTSFMQACGHQPSIFEDPELYDAVHVAPTVPDTGAVSPRSDIMAPTEKEGNVATATPENIMPKSESEGTVFQPKVAVDKPKSAETVPTLDVQQPVASDGGFSALPEGALLRVAAQMDLNSGRALTAVNGAARESTAAALRALSAGIEQAKHEHNVATAAIEVERAEGRERRNAQGNLYGQVMELLAPLRNSRSMQRQGALITQLFNELEQGQQPAGLSAEAETALESRAAEAAAAAHLKEVAMRARVAEGDLHGDASHLVAVLMQTRPTAACTVSDPATSDTTAARTMQQQNIVEPVPEMPVSIPFAQNVMASVVPEMAVALAVPDAGAVTAVEVNIESIEEAVPQQALASEEGLAALPEAALLRITAQMDLHSGLAFTVADSAARESTAAGLQVLSEGIAHAKQQHDAAKATIEQERARARERHTAQGGAYAAAMEALAPLRNNTRAQRGRGAQFAQLFTLLEQGSAPEGLSAEEEAALDARAAEAAAAARLCEEGVRDRIAIGDLRLTSVGAI